MLTQLCAQKYPLSAGEKPSRFSVRWDIRGFRAIYFNSVFMVFIIEKNVIQIFTSKMKSLHPELAKFTNENFQKT